MAILSVLFARAHVIDPAPALALAWGRHGARADRPVAGLRQRLCHLAIRPAGVRRDGERFLYGHADARLSGLAGLASDHPAGAFGHFYGYREPAIFFLLKRRLCRTERLSAAGRPAKAREAQRLAYPDVEPVVVDLDADEAMALVLKTAAARGWRTIDKRPPGGRTGEGHVDFIDRTFILGIDEDITRV